MYVFLEEHHFIKKKNKNKKASKKSYLELCLTLLLLNTTCPVLANSVDPD